MVIFLPLIIVCLLFQSGLYAARADSGIVLLIETGVTDDGRPICREASSDNPGAQELLNYLESDPRIRKAAEAYTRMQIEKRDRLLEELRAAGLSEEEVAIVKDNTPIHPSYFAIDRTGQVNSSSIRGFDLTDGSGGHKTMDNVSLVHVAVNSPTMLSKNLTDRSRSLTHELGHCMMGTLYDGEENFPKSNFLGKPHWRGKVTDPGLALIEGWAEFIGPYFSGDQSKIIPIDAGDYSFNEDTGDLKSYDEMIATEGVVASIFWDMMKSDSGISDPWKKVGLVFQKHRPGSMADFERSFLAEYPDDARAVFDIMSRNTFMANISSEAAARYRDFMEGRISRDEYVAWLKEVREESWNSYQEQFASRRTTASEATYEWNFAVPETGAVYTDSVSPSSLDSETRTGGYEQYTEYLNRAFKKRYQGVQQDRTTKGNGNRKNP